MLESYLTIKNVGREMIVVKKSKFVASVSRAETEEDALAFIQSVSEEHRDATHNVSAYQIGERDNIQRYNDDGEPSGTAGVPVLEVIKNIGLKDTVVVVTRYFGGTLLGASGLIRAYGQAAKEGIVTAGVVERTLHQLLKLTLDYTFSGKVQNEIMNQGVDVVNTEYTDKVSFTVLLPPGTTSRFKSTIIEITSANVIFESLGEQYAQKPVNIP